jgi:YVTN family beta-propeller protein
VKPTIASRLTVLALAILALVFGTGCDQFDVFPVFYNLILDILGGGEPYFDVECENGINENGVANAFYANVLIWSTTIVDCSKSTDGTGRQFTFSEAFLHFLMTGTTSAGPSSKASSNGKVSLVDTYANLVPLPFGPPVNFTNPVCGGNVHSFLVNHSSGTVTDVGMCPQPTTTVIPVGTNPLQVAMTPDGATALVTRYDNAVVWIDSNTDQVTFTLNTPNIYPSGIAISPDGTRAYVTNYFDINPSLLVIDLVKRAILTTVPLGQAYPRSVTIIPDGSQVWVNYLNRNVVDIVDTLTLTTTNSVGFNGAVSTGMAFNPTGTKAFIATSPNLLTIVDTQTLRTIATVTVGASPNDVVVTADGRRVFVNSDTSGVLSVVDASTNQLLQSLTTNGGSMGLVVFPANLK